MKINIGKIKLLGLFLCILFFYSCSDKTEKTNKQIVGTWTLENNPSCKWTFCYFDSENVPFYNRYLCNIVVDTIRASSRWAIDGNTLFLSADGTSPSVDAVLSIDEITNKHLRISGTLHFHYYDYSHSPAVEHNDYIDIAYAFRKTN